MHKTLLFCVAVFSSSSLYFIIFIFDVLWLKKIVVVWILLLIYFIVGVRFKCTGECMDVYSCILCMSIFIRSTIRLKTFRRVCICFALSFSPKCEKYVHIAWIRNVASWISTRKVNILSCSLVAMCHMCCRVCYSWMLNVRNFLFINPIDKRKTLPFNKQAIKLTALTSTFLYNNTRNLFVRFSFCTWLDYICDFSRVFFSFLA